MKQIDFLIEHIPEIEKKLGYSFKDRSHLTLAFVHRSFINENKMIDHHNERLEFLGDSILGMLISDYLYHLFPNTPEGDLSYLRSRLVEATSCVEYIKSLDIASYVLLGKGEKMNDGRGRDSLLADLFEAIIGAIYLDGGLHAAKDFLFLNFQQQINQTLKTPLKNWKALLQDICQKKFQKTPVYKLVNMTGPDHSKSFEISVIITYDDKEEMIGHGIGLSKKEAQQAAAENALKKLNPI